VHFPSCFTKILSFSSYFYNFPPVLGKFTCFLHGLCVFRFPPYFDHDAFMHHPMHVLDAPGFMSPAMSQQILYYALEESPVHLGICVLVFSQDIFIFQSGLKSGVVVDAGLKPRGLWVLKVQQMEVRSKWLRVSSQEYLFNYAQIIQFLKRHHRGTCFHLIFLYIVGHN